MATAAPGWYPDTERLGYIRYWDGQRWSDYRLPATGAKLTQSASQNATLRSVATRDVTIVAAIVLPLGILGATTSDEDPALDYAANNKPTTEQQQEPADDSDTTGKTKVQGG